MKPYKKEYYQKNKESIRASHKKYYEDNKLDHYIIYYLPEEHYCGYTNNPNSRMRSHKNKNKYNTDGWRVLGCANSKLEAIALETEFHLMGMNGHKDMPFVKQ